MTTIISGSSPSITFSDGSAQTSATRPFLNRIINGAMVIDQRNAGASVTPTGGQYTLDRWVFGLSQASKLTAQQNAGSVTPPAGFINYLGVTSSSAYTLGTSDFFMLSQFIEGLNVSDLAWGTANAKTVTLSFWVRSSLTGTFGGALQNSANNRSYPFTYTISSANTWEQKSITIAGDTTGTWLTTNGVGIGIRFGLGVGSTNSGTAGAWAGSNFISATGATSVVGTNGATFYITGVQLEVGSTATSFDYRPYGTELALCQRYCFGYGGGTLGGGGGSQTCAFGIAFSSSSAVGGITFPVAMRTAPSVSVATVSNFFVNNLGSNTNATNITANSTSPLTSDLLFSLGSSPLTTNTPIRVFGNASSLAIFSAEL